MEFKHEPVLLEECITQLNIKPNNIYVDGTMGGGGHSFHILKELNNTGKLIGIDRDKEAIKAASERLKDFSNFVIVHNNHSNIKEVLSSLNIDKVSGILLDLGVSSFQLDEPTRGFSYMNDAKLDMRMNKEDELSAYDIVNKYSEVKLTDIFFKYGEERFSKRIAKNICEKRKEKEILTTMELVDIIKASMPRSALNEKQHPAKRVFQAIRIEVNEELSKLKNTIVDCVDSLSDNGRLLIITFHSLEDKIVKHTFLELQGKCTCPSDFPVCICNYKSYGKVLSKKAIIALELELKNNPRARSAKLRVFERNIK